MMCLEALTPQGGSPARYVSRASLKCVGLADGTVIEVEVGVDADGDAKVEVGVVPSD